jgi:threonine aldolase
VSPHPRVFASDNFSGAHPEVLAALAEANDGHAPAYGEDPWTARAEESFRRHFGDHAEAFPVFNGTAANVLALDALTRPYEAVICAATAHLNADECGAPERIAGVKLLTVDAEHGKLSPELVAPWDARRGDQHAVQPRVVSISQATELGTVYNPAETRTLAEFCHRRDMLLHVDGARLANAAASLDVALGEIAAGADVVSFGGTKNGLLVGDAVVFLRAGLAERFEFVRKQGMQLASKMRFLSAQFHALLGDDLWLRNAAHANAMARRLRDAVEPIDGVQIVHPVDANSVFARLPEKAIARLRSEVEGDIPFYIWEEDTGECRWMCSWDTTGDEVDRFAGAVGRAVEASR